MRVPYGWLRDFVDCPIGPKELADKLTMAGLEVEGIESIHGDTVLEVNVTPNRPDCLSILGIAREASALLHLPLTFPEYGIRDEAGPCDVLVEIIDEDLCYRYAGRAIKGVTIKDSPDWMKKRLEQCGMRAINNIVDITNYLLLEIGHPLHAFDMDTIEAKTIRIRRSLPSSTIRTLDGSERGLPGQSLLIWDGSRPVAVAGVMGGLETEVSGKTRNVFLESAYFLPSSIRRTSRLLGLKTESSYRFERGTDIEMLEHALNRAALLMGRLAGGIITEKVDAYPRKYTPQAIKVRYGRVSAIIGTPLSRGNVADIMQRLGIHVTEDTDFFTATPPPFRTDIVSEIDIIEEVARFYGYDKVPVTVPKTCIPKETKDRGYSRVTHIKDSMRSSGFTEVINYSFMSGTMLDTLLIPEDDPRRRTVAVRNPLNVEESLLRTFLLPSLIQNLILNVSRETRDVRLYEISRIFRDRGEPLPEEIHFLGALYLREKVPTLWKEDVPDFYLVKGALESVFAGLTIADYQFNASSEPFLHPGQSAEVIISGERAGYIGILRPDITGKLSLRVAQPNIVVTEINLDRLLASVPGGSKYAPLPHFPSIDRDVAIIVDESLAAASITDKIKAYPSELIENVTLFDFYRGKNIPAGKKSLAFSVRYRAKDRTLTDAEIEELHGRLVTYLSEQTGGSVRGT